MKKQLQEKLMDEIFVATAMIQKEFPELQNLLSETPLLLFDKEGGIKSADFEHYLESLKTQLALFEEAASYQKMCE